MLARKSQIEHVSEKGRGERRLVVTKAELLYILTLTAATREREGDRQKERQGVR